MLHSFCWFFVFFWNFGGLFQSFFCKVYQTKLEAWTRICLSSGTALFPPKSRLLSRNLFALSTWVSKWVIIASCSHFFKTLTIIIIATPTVRRQRPTPKVINWNSSCNVQKEVFIRFSWGQISIDDFWCLSLPSDSCRGYDDYSQCFKKMWTWCYHYPFGDLSW